MPVALYVPGSHAHGYRRSPMSLLLLRDGGVRRGRAGRARRAVERPARRRPVEHAIADSVAAGSISRVVVTGAAGQLGHALLESVPAPADSRTEWTSLPAAAGPRGRPRLHAAAWTDVRRRGGRSAGSGGCERTAASQHAAELARRSSPGRARTLDGHEARAIRRVGRPVAARRVRAHEAPRRGCGGRARVDRALVVSGRHRRTSCGRLRLGADRDEVAVTTSAAHPPTSATSPTRHALLELPYGVYHVAAQVQSPAAATW